MRHPGGVSETLSTAGEISGRRDSGSRGPLTHVPLSRTPLPPLDDTAQSWPGTVERVGELDLHVRYTSGTGKTAGTSSGAGTAVYVHGLGGSSTNWTDLAGQLAPAAAGMVPDLPGFGFSEPVGRFTFSLAAHVDVVVRLIEQRAVGPVHLIGNSMGGAISLLLAARRPDLVRSLTLISPAMPDRRPDPRRLSDPRIALAYLPIVGRRVRRQLARMTPYEQTEQMLKLCCADPAALPRHRLDELVNEHHARAGLNWTQTALARSTMSIFRTWFTWGPGSLWSVASAVRAPTLVVWGTEDRIISVRRAARTAQLIPRARLLILPRTGHVAQLERPVTVARAVLGMWESIETGRW